MSLLLRKDFSNWVRESLKIRAIIVVALISKSVKVGFFSFGGVLLLLLLLGFFCSPSFDKDLVLVWRIRGIVFLFESCNLLIFV
jgi:hypothetical protein